jgi:CRP/FNR family transcriptional regulator, anaerobic regulatory protein
MLTAAIQAQSSSSTHEEVPYSPVAVGAGALGLEALLQHFPFQRRTVHAKQYVFRAGQPRHSLYLVHAGFFKTCLISEDGREKITGFRLRGDLLGLDALDMSNYACDAIALDVGEVWELPFANLRESLPEFQQRITSILAGEIRRDWHWMLALGTLSAEQRVATFLLDLAGRLEALGFSARRLTLRMTRAEIGNFLALKLETVTRALSKLQAQGLIGVEGRDIRIEDVVGMRTAAASGGCH